MITNKEAKEQMKEMAPKEALEVITHCVDWAEYIEEVYCDAVPYEALKQAQNALDKQIPSKVKWEKSAITPSHITCCPRCDQMVVAGIKYCPECG